MFTSFAPWLNNSFQISDFSVHPSHVCIYYCLQNSKRSSTATFHSHYFIHDAIAHRHTTHIVRRHACTNIQIKSQAKHGGICVYAFPVWFYSMRSSCWDLKLLDAVKMCVCELYIFLNGFMSWGLKIMETWEHHFNEYWRWRDKIWMNIGKLCYNNHSISPSLALSLRLPILANIWKLIIITIMSPSRATSRAYSKGIKT